MLLVICIGVEAVLSLRDAVRVIAHLDVSHLTLRAMNLRPSIGKEVILHDVKDGLEFSKRVGP
jgi:hypothetical protein